MKLYKLTNKGVILKEVSRSMFSDIEAYEETLRFWYLNGWSEEYPIDYEITQGDADAI